MREQNIAMLEPAIKRQRIQINRLKRQSPRTWPDAGVNLVEWRTESIAQMLDPKFVPVGAGLAPTRFVAITAEICTEVRHGVADAGAEWDEHPNRAETLSRIKKLVATNAAAIQHIQMLKPSSDREERARDLYVMHMKSRTDVLKVMLEDGCEVKDRRSRIAELWSEIKVQEIDKVRELALLFQ